jgi:hypothetical protein
MVKVNIHRQKIQILLILAKDIKLNCVKTYSVLFMKGYVLLSLKLAQKSVFVADTIQSKNSTKPAGSEMVVGKMLVL